MATSPDAADSLSDAEIRAGLGSGDLDRIEALFGTLWYDLASRFSPEVLRAVEGIPANAFDVRPRLLHAVLLAYRRTSYTEGDHQRLRRALQFYVVTGQRYGKRLAAFTRPSDLVTAGAAAVVSGRMRGDYKGSDHLGSWTDAQLTLGTAQPTLPWTEFHAAARPGWLSAERGLTATLAGSLDQATRLFTRAHAEAGEPPYAHYAGTNAVASLALLAAWRGHLDLARTWLDALEQAGPIPDWVEQLTTVGAQVAGAFIAIDEGEPTTAAALLDRLGPATQDVELWPFVAFANASYEAHYGDPHKGLRMLDTARQRHGALDPDPTTMTGELVLRAEAKLLLRVGAGSRVLHLADRHAEVESLMLYAAWAHDLSVNDQMGLHLVQATANLRTGHADRAGGAFLSAIRLRSTPRHLSPFLALSDTELDELARLAQVGNPLHDGVTTARYNTPPSGPLVHLTRREREVLRALSAGRTAAQAAAQFGVSVTTVRTQIRKIYQKLHVSQRREALAKAQHLGLLRVPRAVPGDRAG